MSNLQQPLVVASIAVDDPVAATKVSRVVGVSLFMGVLTISRACAAHPAHPCLLLPPRAHKTH
jgi:hypothetical protein